jgi:hypothetical protein
MRRMLVLVALVGCDGASPDLGLASRLHVEGGQFRPGPFPADDGGPATSSLVTRQSMIVIDRVGEGLRAILAPDGRAAAIGLVGSDDAWIVVAGPPDSDTPGQPVIRTTFALAPDFPAGPFELRLAASDDTGRFGEAVTRAILALDEPPPEGELVVGLVWEGRADLDIHVVDPLGGEAWSDDPNTYVPPPPGTPADPLAYQKGGILDRDGNKDCRRDGRPREHVIWQMPPPAGEYIVRVDARAMCGAPLASWYAFAIRGGELLAEARGLATPEDAVLPPNELGRGGVGTLALKFTVP